MKLRTQIKITEAILQDIIRDKYIDEDTFNKKENRDGTVTLSMDCRHLIDEDEDHYYIIPYTSYWTGKRVDGKLSIGNGDWSCSLKAGDRVKIEVE